VIYKIRLLIALAIISTLVMAQGPKPNWKRVEADNGASYAIDLNSISRGSGNADAVICIVENDVCDIMNQRRWVFYCSQNRIGEFPAPSQYVPPLSIGRRILDLVCGK
jgi:hypothetical protein